MPSNSPIGLSSTVAIRTSKLRTTFFQIENRGFLQAMSKTERSLRAGAGGL
jgi:hypothetical protein